MLLPASLLGLSPCPASRGDPPTMKGTVSRSRRRFALSGWMSMEFKSLDVGRRSWTDGFVVIPRVRGWVIADEKERLLARVDRASDRLAPAGPVLPCC